MDLAVISNRLIDLWGEQSQNEIANQLNIAQSTYAMYESGKRVTSDDVREVDVKKIQKLEEKFINRVEEKRIKPQYIKNILFATHVYLLEV